jgi:2,3-bisphosphoglycerate-independent phosphoglycerate mutase
MARARDAARPRKSARRLWVMSSDGSRRPYLRGMIAHDLLLRGLPFDDAYALASALRDRLASRESSEISSVELEDLLQEMLAALLPPERLALLGAPVASSSLPEVLHDGEHGQPFSRGLLARSLMAAGLDTDRAYRIAIEVHSELQRDALETVDNAELGRRIGAHLERREGRETAARYRTMRRIGRLPRPLVLYLGGATGTGKSSLAVELAPLLRIYQINATDTIRQVMRMVFSPAILPGLHRSSFEGGLELPTAAEPASSSAGEPPASAVLRAFEEQATRVCVGVRAVVERAMAENMSVVLEGVHLVPPLVPFPDLEGGAFQVMLMLSTMDEEIHRARFLRRGGISGRQAAHYLEHLRPIREIQEFLLLQAEHHDVSVLDTREWDFAVPRALRLVAGALEQAAPWIGETEGQPAWVPTLCLFIDGIADRPVRVLGDRTPLEAAATPTLDRLAREGACGLADPLEREGVPDTAAGALALFGQPPAALERGPVEALGVGLDLSPADIALRGNFATLDDRGRVADRRASRIREGAPELAAALDGIEVEDGEGGRVVVNVRAATEHRLAIVLHGEGLSSAIWGSDPGEGSHLAAPLQPRAKDPADAAARRTAEALRRFETAAREVLRDHPLNRARREQGLHSADAILTRGAGRLHRVGAVEPGGKPLAVSCISGDYTVLGVASAVGARVVSGSGITANLDTNLRLKFELAQSELENRDLVVLHVKGADIAAHDRRPDLKKEFLERIDRELERFLTLRSAGRGAGAAAAGLRVAVAADHATLSELGHHGAGPVPVLIWGEGVERDSVRSFDESSVAAGRLHRFPLRRFLERLASGSP